MNLSSSLDTNTRSNAAALETMNERFREGMQHGAVTAATLRGSWEEDFV